MLLCHYLLTFGGEDSANKHGISAMSATRLGGVAIVAYMLMHLGYQLQLGVYTPSLDQALLMMTCLAFFLLGVFEDLRRQLNGEGAIPVHVGDWVRDYAICSKFGS